MAGKKTGKRLLTWVLVLVMALSLLPLNALAKSNSTVVLHPSVGSTVTGVKVKVGDIISGHRVSSISSYDITVDLGKYNVNNDTFRLPYAKDIWKGVDNNKVDYISWAGSGSNRRSEGASALLANGKNTAYYYFKGAPVLPTFTLNYNANGGTGAPASQTHKATSEYEKSHTFTISSQAPTRDGYTFLGWNTNRSATTANYQPGGSIVVTGTTTLYAVWEENTPPTDKPAKPTENDVTGVVVDIVCVTTTGTHVMVQYPLGHPTDAQHTIGEVVSDGAGGYICPVTVRTAWFVQQASDLVWKVQHTKTASTITFNLTYDKNSETWVKPAANPRIKATHEVTPDEPGDTKPDFEKEKAKIRVQCVEWPSQHDPYTKNYGILPGAYTDRGMDNVDGTYVYTIELDKAQYIARFDQDINKSHTDTEPNEKTYIEWRWENGAWHLIGGPDGIDADIKVKCGQTETPPEAPTAVELEKLEMAVLVKCDVDDAQQHTEAYGLLGEYNEDYIVGAPKKVGNDWLCDINYVPDPYVAEFNKTFPNLKHIQNDEKIDPVTLIWGGENWQIKTQGRVHVTEEYTVTFNAYGGFPTPDEQHVKSGEKAVLPAEPTLKGHTFAFWYLGEDEQNATAYDFNTPVTENITLTAKWNINKYTVTFDSYGGTPVPPAQEVEYGLTATKPDDPTLKGYTFAFWYLGEDEQNATAYDFNTPVTENITLTAKWNINKYTVTFNSYGGTPVPPAQEVEYGLTATEPATAPTKTGYTFDGWYLGDEKYDFSDAVEQNITLYANWEKNIYTVTYTDGVDGEEVFADQVYENLLSGIDTPAFNGTPTRDGYRFTGWEPEVSDTVTGNVTYAAQWTPRTDLSYTVHYYLKNTTKQVADDKTVNGQTFNADVTEKAIRISGYRVYGDSVKSITIGTGTNEIIFYYTRASRPSASSTSKPTLNTGDHYAYVMGYPDGTVRPNGSITRAEVSAILFRLLSDKTRDEYFTTESSFTDVKAGAWYNNSIATLEKAGVIVDTAKGGAFRPNEAITRAELAAMLAQFSDAKPVKGVKFSDVSAEHWAYEAIAIAAKMGWIEGYPDGTFRPDATITRAEMMTLVNRALERVPSDEDHLLSKRVMLTFPDCKSGDWFYIAVQEATNSHTYERAATEKNGDEQWTALRANRDWTLLEK